MSIMSSSGRQLRNSQGDDSTERQILLLKLQHEYDTAPKFGNEYISDADFPANKWISRIGALLARSSIQHKTDFNIQRKLVVQFWRLARDGFRTVLSDAIEEIKLELELEGRENIGQVYEAEREFDFFTDLKGIIMGASKEIFVIDAYFDGAAFVAYLGTERNGINIKILCGNYADDVAFYVKKYTAQTQSNVEIRKTRAIHDRVIFLDRVDCWVVGASIKDAGKKPTYLMPLTPQITPRKLAIYETEWLNASIVIL